MTEVMTPRDHALRAVQEGLDRDPAMFVALAYLGMLVPDALAPLREGGGQDDIIGRILSVPPAPEPAYARVRVARPAQPRPAQRVRQQSLMGDGRVSRSKARQTRERSLFAQWMEGEVAWSPAVMGWDDDDVRADAMIGVDGYEGE